MKIKLIAMLIVLLLILCGCGEESKQVLPEKKQVTVTAFGEEMTLQASGQTVQQLLQSVGIQPEGNVRISHPMQARITDGMHIILEEVRYCLETTQCAIAPETLCVYDPSVPQGEQQLLIAGEAGLKQLQTRVMYVNGKEKCIEVLESTVSLSPKPQVVAVGTGERVGEKRRFPLTGDGILLTAKGELLRYSRVDTYNATAYTSWVADTKGTTACGTKARVGAVAVDPKVIPYFTKMYIVSEDGVFDYGVASAEDCGGAVKGKIIDLFFNTLEECCQFGRRDITVYFLTE